MPTASGAGSAQGQGSSSVSQFLSTLIPVGIIAGVIFAVFLFFRARQRRVYQPRTYVDNLDEEEKTPQPSTSMFGWISDYRSHMDQYVLDHNSLDNFFFLRFFKILTAMCLIGAIITWPILFPVNATGGGGQSEFDAISFSNVANPIRYYAHCFVAIVFLTFVMLLITRETALFINIRQAYMLTPAFLSRVSSRTVLFTSVPKDHLNEAAIRGLFSGVRYVWLQPDCKELEDMVEERDKAAVKLETGENKMCQTLVKKNAKADKKANKSNGKGQFELTDNNHSRIDLDEKDRPTHKLKFLIGKKVDTINWARSELQSLEGKIENARHGADKEEKLTGVFVEFETIEAAQAAFQQVKKQKSVKITPKAIGLIPSEVIWKNLKMTSAKYMIFGAACTTFITLLIIFWSIPVAFVGAISNIDKLADTVSWLAWIKKIPSPILGVVTGLLPTILLAALMALVPIICRLLAGLFEPTSSAVELKTQSWYFAFQVVQVFLITTFSSGAVSAGGQIAQDPTQAPLLLAQNLPKASNFYICYFILYGLNAAALQILNIVPLLFILVLGKILDKTPRKVFNRYTSLVGLGWGSVYPVFTNLGVIALAYSCIAPLVLGFAAIGFGLLYLAYRYQMLFVMGTKVDMKGRAYARALQQLFVGVYLSEFCLIGLFAIGTAESAAATGPLVIMIIFAAFTVIYHIAMRKTLGDLIDGTELVTHDSNNRLASKIPADVEAGDATGKDNPRHSRLDSQGSTLAPAPTSTRAKGGIFGKLQNAIFHSTFAKFTTPKRTLAPHFADPIRPYTQDERATAYLNPALASPLQVIWIARDKFGLSSREVGECQKFGIRASDEEASWNEKAGIEWDRSRVQQAPIWDERARTLIPY